MGTMNEAPPTPASVPQTLPAEPAGGRSARQVHSLLAIPRASLMLAAAVIRRPLLLVACAALLALFGFGAWMGTRQIWAWHEFRAGRTALERYSPLEASEHFEACLQVWPNDPDALVLAARAARRLDAFEKAEELLNRAHGMKRNYDPILERLMLRAARGELDQV